MTLRWSSKLPVWATKLTQLKAMLSSAREFGPTPPRGNAHRTLRTQWIGVCIAIAVLLNAAMYFGLRWTYPTDESIDFREEVSTLLSVQGFMMAKRPGEIIPSMDSIRDVVFGPKVVGAAVLKRSKEMIKERKNLDLDPVLVNTLQESVKRWERAQKDVHRQQTAFVLGFATLSLGGPILLFLLGLPAYAAVHARIVHLNAKKLEKRANVRRAATTRAKAEINRQRRHAPRRPEPSSKTPEV
jgi:hypothetical protein